MPEEMEISGQPQWLGAFLTTIGAMLAGSLLIWIAANQVSIVTSQAVLQRDFQAQAKAILEYNTIDRAGDLEVKEWFKQIWPRLRVHGENVAILKRYMEDVCACEVELKQPERF